MTKPTKQPIIASFWTVRRCSLIAFIALPLLKPLYLKKEQQLVSLEQMHIYLAGIGGSGLGPLARLAHQLGHRVSGSDVVDSAQLDYFRHLGLTINIGQTKTQIERLIAQDPIDWYVYSSALAFSQPPNPELAYIQSQSIKNSKRDQLLNYLLAYQKLQLLAVSGTHGKTTTTAMIIWLLKQLNQPFGYLLGGQIADLPAADIHPKARWFVYEADEYDRNFLAFRPQLSLITGLDWDHFDCYPTRQSYYQAFRKFIDQSRATISYHQDMVKLYSDQPPPTVTTIQPQPGLFQLAGRVNRLDAQLALEATKRLVPTAPQSDLVAGLNQFPGTKRRFEAIAPGLYSDYAHTIPKITGCLQRASELNQSLVVIYEPHSNHRLYQTKTKHQKLFASCAKLYWLPTFLAREDPNLPILTPQEMIDQYVKLPTDRQTAQLDGNLKAAIEDHLRQGQLVIGITAGGPQSLDGWLRQQFKVEPLNRKISA